MRILPSTVRSALFCIICFRGNCSTGCWASEQSCRWQKLRRPVLQAGALHSVARYSSGAAANRCKNRPHQTVKKRRKAYGDSAARRFLLVQSTILSLRPACQTRGSICFLPLRLSEASFASKIEIISNKKGGGRNPNDIKNLTTV